MVSIILRQTFFNSLVQVSVCQANTLLSYVFLQARQARSFSHGKSHVQFANEPMNFMRVSMAVKDSTGKDRTGMVRGQIRSETPWQGGKISLFARRKNEAAFRVRKRVSFSRDSLCSLFGGCMFLIHVS